MARDASLSAMIGRLTGRVEVRDSAQGQVLLDVGGVGYEVRVSLQTLAAVPQIGESISLWIHTHVREDIIALYGFATTVERDLYRLLTSVPKVGPRHAITTLGGLDSDALIDAVAESRVDRLTKIPGIGKKTAEQIALTLREKVELLRSQPVVESDDGEASTNPDTEYAEVHEVLVALGWKPKQVSAALDRLLSVDPDVADESLDTIVRRTLAQLMG